MSAPAELEALEIRCEQASGPDREIDLDIARSLGWTKVPNPTSAGGLVGRWKLPDGASTGHEGPPRYTASLDAAMTLVPAGWNWMAGNRNQPLARAYVENGVSAFVGAGSRRNPARQWFEVVAGTSPLALCAAALRARAAAGPLSLEGGE